MYLEKLELIGFKSFADKTDMNFEHGLTVVVGPNGCGKSNVVDAIKWVLGEQSVKSLRGSEMTDVIFNGTSHRKSSGYAEVSLIFSNTKNILPVDYDEVRVTRRLYRTGESEYFLNKTQCRLKDIKELFMGTGVGVNAYSVIEQGRIDVLLQANAQERRIIFEEAAGISKYKAKKKTALSKLERVEQNLVRLSDIIAEVQKQMRSLQRQVGKARRFREYTQQLRELKTAYALRQYHVLLAEYQSLQQAVQEAQTEHGQKQARLEQIDAEASRLATQAVEIEQALRELESQRIEIDGRIRTCENDVQRSRDRIQEAQEARSRYQGEIHTIHGRVQEVKAELVRSVEAMEVTEIQIAEHSAEAAGTEDGLKRLSEEAAQIGQQIQTHRSAMLELLTERTGYTNQLASLESDHKVIDAEMTRGKRRCEVIEKELLELGMFRRETESAIGGLSDRLRQGQERLAVLSREIAQLEESLLSLDERMAQQRDLLSAKEARRQTLQDLERRREGMGAGVKQILNAVQTGSAELKGIPGTVSELFEVDVEYAVAIEAALANAAQMIVTENIGHARSAIEFLRKDDRGRATFLPLDRARPAGNGHPPMDQHPGYVGRASKFIRAKAPFEEVLGQLLSGTHLVRDFETALELAPHFPPTARLVTLEGDTVSSAGPITAGGTVDRLGIISRRSELRQLEAELARIRELMSQLAGERNQTVERLQELRRLRQTTQEEIGDINQDLIERRAALEQTEREIASCEQEQRTLNSEMANCQHQLVRIAEQQAEMQRQIESTNQRETDLKNTLASLDVSQRKLEASRDELRDRASRLHAALAGLRQKLEGLKSTRNSGYRTLQEQKDLLLGRYREIEQCDAREAAAQAEIRNAEAALKTLFDQRREREDAIRKETNRKEETRQETEKNAAEIRQARTELHGLEERLQNLRVDENRAQLKLENTLNHARQELGMDLPEAYKTYAHNDQANWEAVREDIQSLEERIRNLGNVYEDAIEEYEALELRQQTLTTQEQDLLQAKVKLQEIIRKINRTSRRLFETTFAAVKENFQAIFAKLFGGGKADIFLEEGVDILEAGIEIVARPPGKSENTVLSLLSGGEKALCTVALLFAIFKARPSPFCILDEVDAPLDENNIDRFISLVVEFNQNTQFLVVTHNRRTMRAADSIYGITMQEPGVSTKVSVRFEDMENE